MFKKRRNPKKEVVDNKVKITLLIPTPDGHSEKIADKLLDYGLKTLSEVDFGILTLDDKNHSIELSVRYAV